MRDEFPMGSFIFLATVAAIVYWLFAGINNDCKAKGGVVVRGLMGLECVKAGILK